MDLPLDWNNVYSADELTAGIHAESISDGLIISLTNLGAVDIEYIAQISGYTYKEVIETLKGSIYQNPMRWDECFYKGWETAEEYLSGNLMCKYKAAKEANTTYNGYFADNLKAIEAVLPVPVPAEDIYVTLGSPWVPPDIIDDFIEYLLGPAIFIDIDKWQPYRNVYPVSYEPLTGTWNIHGKGRYERSIKTIQTYGTLRMSALYIIEKTLNMKSLQVFDEVPSQTAASHVKKSLNRDETISAQEKQKLIIKEFQKWIWNDEQRKKRLEMIYEDNFSSIHQRHYDGQFLTMPGMSPEISLYPYQKNAVARIIFTPNTLLAHEVGAGKTYIMVAAGMELRRMGISRKNVYVVPNNIVGQWKKIFLQIYPHANLLTVEPKVFTPEKRQNVLQTIRDKDFDAIIIAYSCFELVPMSKKYYENHIQAEIAEIEDAIGKAQNDARLNQRKKSLEKKYEDIHKTVRDKESSIFFDDLGINTLFVDEAHNFKNIPIEMKIGKVLGVNKTGSAKCVEMLDKVRCVQHNNNGRGVVFATGTPITNSVTDIFVMQTYLQYGELKFLDLNHFDNWAQMFAEMETVFEIDVDTSGYRLATRFSKFHNLQELADLLAQIADFHKVDKTNEIPDFNGYDDRVIPKTAAITDYLKDISDRADAIRKGLVKRTDDNMLKLTSDGRKAALDIRLVAPETDFTCDCKVYQCAENILHIYRESADKRLTQLVFCDSSTPKAGFNIYDELKNLLVCNGVPGEDIAFVQHYDTEKKREGLFKKVQNGEIRILVGSTFTLGMGVNVQKKLVAIHHLDIPWRPADMIQREGRILRQGNENKNVRIFRYITDGSFDAYSWQLLETKQRFISQLLNGSVAQRSASDVDDVVLNYAEIKALAIGNPLIKKRVETANDLKRACTLQRKLFEAQSAMKQEMLEIPGKIAYAESLIEKALSDIERYNTNKKSIKEMKNHRQIGADILKALTKNVMQKEKRTLFMYQGFNIVLPDNMLKEKPFIWLEGSGRYYTEVGDSDIGCVNRIDNKLNSLPEFIEKQQSSIDKLSARKADIEIELKRDNHYAAEIEILREKLNKIDRKLGVDIT